jgi:hypothetical protein
VQISMRQACPQAYRRATTRERLGRKAGGSLALPALAHGWWTIGCRVFRYAAGLNVNLDQRLTALDDNPRVVNNELLSDNNPLGLLR